MRWPRMDRCFISPSCSPPLPVRRLVLAAYHIWCTHYWVGLIKALILAKVILIGDALRLGRRLEHKRLIYPTLLKTVLFSLFVGVFTILEEMIKGLLKGQGLARAFTLVL